ncbi:MAG: IS3 family transposase [Planctomycetes bacterium]|nr:IS3 family transposase [Planctomycetota bacterium]
MSILLRHDGVDANHKRVWRVYRDAGLSVRKTRRKRIAWASRPERSAATKLNERWSMDFMNGSLADGRSLPVLNIVDDFSRRALTMEVDLSLPAQRVIRALEQAGELYGLPSSIVVDNGPEFTSKVLDAWCHEGEIEPFFIRPGKPIENAYAESFNGRVREECLNQHAFESVAHARSVIEGWREDYNTVRPHSSLDGLATEKHLQQ